MKPAMTPLSDRALQECADELRAACRRPIDAAALDTLLTWIHPTFKEILERPDGARHWTEHGTHMRDNGRYIGALADFFAYEADVDIVGAAELLRAFTMVRDVCRVGADSTDQRPRATPPLAVKTTPGGHVSCE